VAGKLAPRRGNAVTDAVEPTREQLEHALRASGCTCDLDHALSWPPLALALKKTALALARPPDRQPPPTPPAPVPAPAPAPRRAPLPPRQDYRMRAAHDDTGADE
jgi:hypothetical protein